MRVCVVIPIYKNTIDKYEEISLLQCLKILSPYDKVFVGPETIDLYVYRELSKNINVRVEYFDKKYFADISGYNRLCLSKELYSRFLEYEHLLIYQLDSFVFRDDIAYWCNTGYDFIGAPWFFDYDGSRPDVGLHPFSGNGGFSLRKVQSFLNVLNMFKLINAPTEIFRQYENNNILQKIISLPKIIGKMVGIRNNTYFFRNNFQSNEDKYFAFHAKEICKEFTPAPSDVALNFSFDRQPQKLYLQNGSILPFGCHAWPNYLSFWRPFIQKYGFTI